MENILTSMKGLKVAVIGDVMLDHYVWGDADRISPEAPVPVVHVGKDTYVPGGAANVALNVKSMGADAVLIGATAHDDAGGQLSTTLHAAGVSFDPRFQKSLAPTIVKTRVIVRNQQLCRIDREDDPIEYSLDADEDLWCVIEEKLKTVDAVIFSDYAKGVVSEKLIQRVQEAVGGRGCFTAIDPKPRHPVSYKGLDLVTPNRAEALLMSRVDIGHSCKFPTEDVCRRIYERYECRNTVITLGGEGMLLSTEGAGVKVIPTVACEVFDVSGAGDTVIAALTMALAGGSTLEESARFANLAAGVVVGKLGTATVTPGEILDYQEKADFKRLTATA